MKAYLWSLFYPAVFVATVAIVLAVAFDWSARTMLGYSVGALIVFVVFMLSTGAIRVFVDYLKERK